MKKQRFFMLGIITVLVAVLSLTFVSSTFAKYTSSYAGSDTAQVAKWQWTLNTKNLNETVEFDLFNTIMDSNGTDPETDVKENLIAPGTSGKFALELKNLSEVDAEYTITFNSSLSSTETYLPIMFTLKDEGGNVLGNSRNLSELNYLVNQKAIDMLNGSATYTVEWAWDFNADDTNDTKLGIEAQSGAVQYTVSYTIVMTQVD